MGRFARSWALAKESWAVLQRQPGLMAFPLISGVVTLVITASFFVPLYLATGGQDLERVNPYLGYPLLAVFYLVTYFIVIFFNSGLVACAHESLSGRPTSFASGIDHAVRKLPAIFGWALIAATVGIILNIISERVGIVGKLIVALFGAAWNIVTYFVIPIIVVEQGSPVQAVKKSAGMLRKTWGENLIGQGGMGLVHTVLAFAPVIPLGILAFTGMLPLLLAVGALSVVYWLALAVVASAMQGIYQTALYVYAETGAVPSGYSSSSIVDAFKQGKGLPPELNKYNPFRRKQ
jgi:hypothetical protein